MILILHEIFSVFVLTSFTSFAVNFVILGDMYLYTVRLTDVVDCLPRKSCTVTDAKIQIVALYGLQLWKGVSIMNKKIKTDAVDSLFDAVLCLQSREECYSFFEDLCTVNELLSLSQRFEVAAMLKDGKTYLEIAEKTGASTATISRVNRSLNYGNDGYELVFGRMEKKDVGK